MPKSLDNIQQKQIFIRLLVFSLVTVMVWVFFSLFRTQQNTAIPPQLLKLAEPLTPTIDTATLNELEQKRSFTPEELRQFPIYVIARNESGIEQIKVKSPSSNAAGSTQTSFTASASSLPTNRLQTSSASATQATP